MRSESQRKAAASCNIPPRTLHNYALRIVAEVDRLRRHQNLHLRPARDHDALLTAASTAASADASTRPRTRTTTSPIPISILADVVGEVGQPDVGEAGAAAAITTGTNWGVSPATADDDSARAVLRRNGEASTAKARAILLLKQRPGLAAPCEQLLWREPVAPGHLRHIGARLEAVQKDARLLLS